MSISIELLPDNKNAQIKTTDEKLFNRIKYLLSYIQDGFQFSAAGQNGWNGQIFLMDKLGKFPSGLVNEVKNFLDKKNTEYTIVDNRKIKEIANNPIDIYPRLKEQNRIPRDYQEAATNAAISNHRGIIKAATGSGKCIRIDSLNLTEDGILDFSEIAGEYNLEPGQSAPLIKTLATSYQYNNRETSSMIYHDGITESIKIKTAYGYHETATPAHRIKVIDKNGEIIWKKFADLEVGDHAALCYNTQLFGKMDMDLDEAYWLGLLIGDGCLTAKDGKVKLTNMDQHIINFVDQYWNKKGYEVHKYQKNQNGKVGKAIDMNIYSKKYREYLYNLGFDYSKSIHKTIPKSIRMLKKEPLSMFIRGLYETDGWVEKSHAGICIGLSNEKLIDQLHVILLNFGIVSSKRKKETTHNDNFILTIYREYVGTFAKEIGFDPGGRKYKILLEHLNDNKITNSNNGIPNVNLILKTLTCEIKNKKDFFNNCEVKWSTVRSWIGKNCWRMPSNENLTLVLKWIIEKNNNLEKTNIAKTLLNNINGIFFNEIISISKEQSDNYDFVVPETHSFIAQGFINHNTQIASMITAKLGVPTIIYVIGTDLLHQFQKDFEKIFQRKIGIVGDGICEIEKITIASIWTLGQALKLDSKHLLEEDSESLSAENFEDSNTPKIIKLLEDAQLHIIDECHVVACNTLKSIYQKINPAYLYGMSGTPFSQKSNDMIIKGILGENLIDINASELIKKGVLAKPIIKFIKAPMPKITGKTYPEIYSHCVVENVERNQIIVDETKKLIEKGYKVLILFNTIKHGDILFDMLEEAEVKFSILSGKDDSKLRDEVKNQMLNKEIDCILASRIFDIGLDLPILSALILSGSGKSYVKSLQRIGRVIRKYEGKQHAAIVEFYDGVKYLKEHSKKRREYYRYEPEFKIIGHDF